MPRAELTRSEEKTPWLRLPVMAEGAEHLVMGYLMRRNILTYKAPPLNEGYDLICIHPDPRHRLKKGEQAQVRVQVKSRYQTGPTGFLVKEKSLSAFDYLVVVLLNIGDFKRGKSGLTGAKPPTLYTLPRRLVRRWHVSDSRMQKVVLRGRDQVLAKYEGELGFERIANALGVPRPSR